MMTNKKVKSIKEWIIQNPKKVYVFSWGVIIISIIINIIVDIYIPNKTSNSAFNIPNLLAKSDDEILERKGIELKKEKILKEFQVLREKQATQGLNKNDSLRVEYLYNEYNKLNNGSKNK